MKCILLSLCFFIFISGAAQTATPILERKISIQLEEEKLPSALDHIARQGGFSFSYNAAIVPPEQTITLKVSGKTVREVLNEIFKGSMRYKEKANHLILLRVPPPTQASVVISIISGYVEDAKTGEKISDVSVFEKESLASAVTDQYGFYKIKLGEGQVKATLNVRKRDYHDTLVNITVQGEQYLNITIEPVQKDSLNVSATTSADSLKEEKVEELSLPYSSEANIQNIHDTLYRDIQISFLPFLGSNERLSGNIINNYSINILGGYLMGTRQIELGFFINIDRGDVSWLQVAGFGNMVGRNVYGIQASGFFNLNGGETKAVQLAGFANTNFGETRGVQLAGLANTNLSSTYGVQVASLSNFSRGKGVGVQVAGFSNVQLGEYKGSQVSGFSNVNTKAIYGTQLATFSNVASGYVEGSQLSAFFNYGKNVKGTQLGLFNFADSLGGVPIGLVSFVRRGYHKIELSANEVFYTNLSFRTGVRKFYNILLAGMKPQPTPAGENVWAYGYGLGTARKINRWLYVNLDATTQQVNKGSHTKALSLLNNLHVGFDFQWAKNFSIYAGATLNGYLTEKSFTDYPVLFNDYQPTIFYDRTVGNNNNLKMWLGWKVGLRFL